MCSRVQRGLVRIGGDLQGLRLGRRRRASSLHPATITRANTKQRIVPSSSLHQSCGTEASGPGKATVARLIDTNGTGRRR